MPANIIPDQSANINLMVDGQILHGQVAEGTPAIKDPLEAIINNVNTLNAESAVSTATGAAKIGVKTGSYSNFTKASNDVAACLEGIDAALASAGGGVNAYSFFDKYIYNAKRFFIHQLVTTGTTVTVAQLQAYLGVDAGYQLDSMSSATNWAGSNVDSSVSVTTSDYFEGGSALSVNKSGTTTSSGGCQRVNFTNTNLTGKKLRVSLVVPTISSGTLSFVRVWVGSGGGFTNFKYWDVTTDVSGATIIAGGNRYIVEVDPAAAGPSGGSFEIEQFNSLRVELILSASSATFTGLIVDHVIYTPDTAVLNVDVYKRKASDGKLYKIKQNADTYSFPALTAGAKITKSTSLDNATLDNGDLLILDVPTSSSYGGQDLFVMVKLL